MAQLIHTNNALYKKWKKPILIRDRFECQLCGSTERLQVHHNEERMADIIKKFINDDEEDRVIINEVVNYHIDNKVSGITLCRKCHKKLHPSLNF